ncbi:MULTISPECIES: hypothetical protein [Niastella]|uniref:Uncharacterized protein n=1 Tax=Niastella soli TaxID=2821487 RepID=A0ABS3Z4H4_9BACT|nr:hypothetical protein [Niastella soli]MBO9204642.1 hypothetical protein [Niastella soli]
MSASKSPTPPSTRIRDHIPLRVQLTSLLPFVIIVLKLFRVRPVAGWSWKWVLSPFWIIGIVGVVYMCGMAAIFYFASRTKK